MVNITSHSIPTAILLIGSNIAESKTSASQVITCLTYVADNIILIYEFNLFCDQAQNSIYSSCISNQH